MKWTITETERERGQHVANKGGSLSMDEKSRIYVGQPVRLGPPRPRAGSWLTAMLALGTLASPALLCTQAAAQQAQGTAETTMAISSQDVKQEQSQPCKRLDNLNFKGSETTVFPSVCDTIDGDMKFRQTLYDYGFLTTIQSVNTFGYDVLGHNVNSHAQKYFGQDPDYSDSDLLKIIFDASRLGLPAGAQLEFGPGLGRNELFSRGTNSEYIATAGLFTPLFHNRVELQVGYQQWSTVFYGNNLGVSSASSALGPTSSILTELGLATSPGTPGFDVRIWGPEHRLYDHFGMFESTSPGQGYAWDTARGFGAFLIPGTGTAFVDELGYRIKRSPTDHFFWVRAGAIYNHTEYPDYDLPKVKKTMGNQGFYLVTDYQITHPDSKLFARGLYFNEKLDLSSPQSNVFADDVAFALYDIGPFNSRPFDTVSVGTTYNRLSHTAERYFRSVHLQTRLFSTTTTASYNAHIFKGVFLSNSLSWVKNPSSTAKLSDALDVLETLILVL